jgi:hypothetical protein
MRTREHLHPCARTCYRLGRAPSPTPAMHLCCQPPQQPLPPALTDPSTAPEPTPPALDSHRPTLDISHEAGADVLLPLVKARLEAAATPTAPATPVGGERLRYDRWNSVTKALADTSLLLDSLADTLHSSQASSRSSTPPQAVAPEAIRR